MGIRLITGQPGHGKTAYAIDEAFKLKKEGREVYAHGIKDMDYDKAGFKYLEDPTKWEDLPDGAVILLDECYTAYPNRNPGSKVPAHVEAMARHRHRGFDFILIAQQGLQLDPFLRGLYEEHVHVRQTSVFKKKTQLRRWTAYQSNVGALCNDVQDWIRPDYVFGFYTSTTKITTKRRVPMWIRYVGIGVVFLTLIGFYVKHRFVQRVNDTTVQDKTAGVADDRRGSAAGGRDGNDAPRYANATEYARAHVPRLPMLPWSAEIYDGAEPVKQPGVFCMSSMPSADDPREASCTCVYEDGSRYEADQPACRRVARYGPEYNPYKPSAQSMQGVAIPPEVSVAPIGAGSSIEYKPGTRSDVFPLNPAKTVGSWTPPVTTL